MNPDEKFHAAVADLRMEVLLIRARRKLGAPEILHVMTTALIGGGARHPHRFEPRDPDIGLVARHAGKP